MHFRQDSQQHHSEDSHNCGLPELAYHAVQPMLFGAMAVTTLRMKYLWTPYMCVLASVGLCHGSIWKALLSKCGIHSNTIVSIGCFFTIWV